MYGSLNLVKQPSSELRRGLAVLSVLGLLVLAGCGASGRLSYDSAQEAYNKGVENFENENYARAARYFQAVFDYGRDNEWASDAQFYLGRSYYQNEKYLLAASEFNRFTQLYRGDERAARAEYMRAMANYKQAPDYQLDQTKTKRALDLFQLFLNRYPESEYRSEAEARITELRERLAHKKFAAAKMYERRERYEASAQTYEKVFDEYPDTDWADNALLGAMRAYLAYSNLSVQSQKQKRLQPALDHYEQLVQLYPDSPVLKKAETLYEKAQKRMNRLTANQS
jgi:outer membrane protein assembly factor BamD